MATDSLTIDVPIEPGNALEGKLNIADVLT